MYNRFENANNIIEPSSAQLELPGLPPEPVASRGWHPASDAEIRKFRISAKASARPAPQANLFDAGQGSGGGDQ